MMPHDRLVVAFVRNHAVGDTFIDWPLHVTIVPWFRFDMTTNTLAKRLAEKLNDLQTFEVLMSAEALFGSRRNKLVNLVWLPSPIQIIEVRVRDFLKSQKAWVVDETTKRHEEYVPHVTAQKGSRIHEGDCFLVDRVYIVEQKDGYKEVTGEVVLGG